MNKNANATIFDKQTSIALKGFLLLCMIWGHMFTKIWDDVEWISIGSINGTTIEEGLKNLTHIAVPLFFFIGGYGFYLTYASGFQIPKLFRQIKKIFVKYWIVFAIFVPLMMWHGNIQLSPFEFFMNLFSLYSTYCGEWWFLSTFVEIVIAMFLVGTIAEKVFKKSLRSAPTALVAAGSLILSGGGTYLNTFAENAV